METMLDAELEQALCDAADREIQLGSDGLTTTAAADFARRPAGVRITLDAEARRRVDRSVLLMRELIATEQPMYGITTGFGDSCVRQISPDKGTIAARDARTVVELVQNIAAIALVATCQAVDLRGASGLGTGTRVAYELVRDHVEFLGHDRRLDGDLAAVVELIRSGAFGEVGAQA